MKKVLVLSLGGSLIMPDKVDYSFIEEFKKEIEKHLKKHSFIAVCGGGARARKYMVSAKKKKLSEKGIALAGIEATKENAELMIELVGNSNTALPKSLNEIKSLIKKHNIVFCGSLKYVKNETTDATAARIASRLKTLFINLTDVNGLYTSNPKEDKTARLIPYISWKDFEEKAKKIKFHLGQHFVLDQKAAEIIRKNKVKTYIIGRSMKNFGKLINNWRFIGTVIDG